MFTAKHIKEVMEAQPFQPFKIHMSDGKTYDLPNHDCAFVSKNHVEVAADLDSDRIPGRLVRCSILHITQIEELQTA